MEVKMDGKDGNMFDFDPKSIDWHSYFLSVHVPAVLKCGRKNKWSVLEKQNISILKIKNKHVPPQKCLSIICMQLSTSNNAMCLYNTY